MRPDPYPQTPETIALARHFNRLERMGVLFELLGSDLAQYETLRTKWCAEDPGLAAFLIDQARHWQQES
jgi:hypothetical protein